MTDIAKWATEQLTQEALSTEAYLEQLIKAAQSDLDNLRTGMQMATDLSGRSYLRNKADDAARHIEKLNDLVSLALRAGVGHKEVQARTIPLSQTLRH